MARFASAGWLVPVVALLSVGLAGCWGSSAPAGLRGAPMVATDQAGVCGLLAREELELVVNARLTIKERSAVPEIQDATADPRVPETTTAQTPLAEATRVDSWESQAPWLLPGMDMCWASSEEGRIVWGAVTAADSDARVEEAFAAYREWHGDNLEGVRVDGHEALWDEELRTLVVLDEDHAFGVKLTIPDPPLDRDDQEDDTDDEDEDDHSEPITLERHLDEDEARYLRQQASELASRALKRL